MRIHPRDRTSIIKRTVVIVLPLVALFFLLFSLYENSLARQATLLLQNEQEKGNAIIANQLEGTLFQFVSDLLTVYDSNEFYNYFQETTPYSHHELEQLFLRIANKKKYINHIRLLDATGMETIKIDHYPDTDAIPSDPATMKDYRDTDLLHFALSQGPDTLYISPISLESHQNNNDGHAGPAMFLTIPVYREGSFKGLLIMDYDACSFLSFLKDYQVSMTKDIVFGLINNGGKWIKYGANICFDYQLHFGDGFGSLFEQAPGIEDQIRTQYTGHYVSQDLAYAYQAVHVTSAQKLSWYPDEGRLWTVVSYFQLSDLPTLSQHPLLRASYLKWVLAFLLLFFGILYIVFLQLRNADKLQLRVSSLISSYSGNGIAVTDEKHRITFCNHAFEVLSGYSQSELMGKSSQDLLLGRSEETQASLESTPVWVSNRDGNHYMVNLTQTHVGIVSRKQEFIVEVYVGSDWKVAEFISYVGKDPQNRLPSLLFSSVNEKLQQQRPLFCLLIHLDQHKKYDFHTMLMEQSSFSLAVAAHIAGLLGTKHAVYAFSHVTYVVFLEGDDTGRVVMKVEELLRGLEQKYGNVSASTHLKAICGFSSYTGGGMSIETLLMQASLATQAIQASPIGNSLQFSEMVNRQFLRKQAILAALPQALLSDSLDLYYQALVDVESGRILGSEALIRWIHPELGFIAPDEFIPLLEQNHMCGLLGEFVIRAAVRFLQDHGTLLKMVNPDFSLAINLSAEELTDPAIIELIGRELREKQVDPQLLELELTERTAVENLHSADQGMEQLHAIGVGITIDDFGTGYSSLSYLIELSIDKIKIDRSFIANYPDPDAITIYKTVVLLAKELGMTVVAEGVETEEQLQFLQQIGCGQYQGFLFSKAVPEAEFIGQLERQIEELLS
ncbi:EAL domain-containing protein [Sphaerochaeta sp. PS]|uniref:sensor domain-containing protein n=1 Tax=Sphaerochaeta sp. PS TaxID=3076336 RepID=UPI0028A44164|nr:EAL domain-containing protein [Sphaerochaeta sp. PS]MDT4762109.1 EAL domain-containing protein [Sphaerochaeta sp. PS]